eukprot:GFYU01009620.1.p2 GENE.GFYU01009620.1~~GFYU01009620.1.p2  ORF type:complete len:206 (-),score=71.28 GFYU01009620.1:23-640(-)
MEFITDALAYIESLDAVPSAIALFSITTLATVSAVITTTPVNFAAGAKLGIFSGAIVFCLACTLGSWINFMLGRYILRDWAEKKLKESPTLMSLERAIKKRSASMVILARLSPVFPFAMVGYALGATSLNVIEYTWATAVGLLPGCLLYSWIGVSVKDVASGDGDGDSTSSYISLAIGVISTVLVSVQAKKVFDEAVAGTGERIE